MVWACLCKSPLQSPKLCLWKSWLSVCENIGSIKGIQLQLHLTTHRGSSRKHEYFLNAHQKAKRGWHAIFWYSPYCHCLERGLDRVDWANFWFCLSWLRCSGWKVLLSQVLPHSGALLPICLAVLNTAQRKSGCRILGGFCLEAAPAYFLQFSYSPSQTWEFSGATWFWKLLPETTRPEGDQLSFLD